MDMPGTDALLSVAQMRRADELAIAGGVPGIELMETAGRGVARCIQRRYAAVPVVVLCGRGMNGGDGFVLARVLRNAGWTIRVGLLGDRDRLNGDAALAADRWRGPVEPASVGLLRGAGLVVDALFGAGLNRDLEGDGLAFVAAMRDGAAAGDFKVVAVDVPSGIDGDSGRVRGAAASADLTVTFFRPKPGHLLMPGRAHMGALRTLDIGIPDAVLVAIAPAQARNTPRSWGNCLASPGAGDHKYRRGHAVIAAGAVMTGAARLAAMAARRVGAGLLTITSPAEVADLYRAGAAGFLVADCQTPGDFEAAIADPRRNAILVGPGQGIGPNTRANAEAALGSGRAVVLDADALTMFKDQADELARLAIGPLVITPHDGEFGRLFPDLAPFEKLERARIAAERLHGVVVLKGADTVIAAPDGRALINDNAPPWLATSGTGDVLAGTVVGLLAQGVPAFEAAAAAVWLNGAAANRVGAGLIAEDLLDHLAPAMVLARG